MGFADISDAAIDDDAGVQNFHHAALAALAAKYSAKGLKVEHLSLAGTDDDSDVRQDKQEGETNERSLGIWHGGIGEHQAHQIRRKNSDDRADRNANQAAEACTLQAELKKKHQTCKR